MRPLIALWNSNRRGKLAIGCGFLVVAFIACSLLGTLAGPGAPTPTPARSQDLALPATTQPAATTTTPPTSVPPTARPTRTAVPPTARPTRTAVPATAVPVAPIMPTSPPVRSQPAIIATAPSRSQPVPTAIDAGSAPCNPGQIKGNINSGIFHAPGQRDYAKTYANVQCFDTEDQARAAGYRKAQR